MENLEKKLASLRLDDEPLRSHPGLLVVTGVAVAVGLTISLEHSCESPVIR